MEANSRVPSYCLHRASGQAVVRLNGKDFYCGRFNSPESFLRYSRLIARWLAGGRSIYALLGPDGVTVDGLASAFLSWAESNYCRGEVVDCRYALAEARRLFGALFVGAFGPAELRACQDAMIEANLSRTTVNARTRKLRRAFKWGVARSMVEPSVLHALQAVEAVRAGRKGVRDDHRDTSPIDDATLERTVAELSPTVAAMVRVQRLTGMRPGEAVRMLGSQIDRTSEPWAYRPASHKTSHFGKRRVVLVGPRARAVLVPFVLRAGDGPVFATPSGGHYSVASYGRAIRRACGRAGVPEWGPNRLRHAAATEIREGFGLEAAQAVLGHSRLETTQVYARRLDGLAAAAVEAVG